MSKGSDYSSISSHRDPIFGLSLVPHRKDVENNFALARIAEDLGLDIIGVQDHPYNGSFMDTWMLISGLDASTKKIRFFADVTDLPMRPPVMLAKASGTLDILTKGRIELGVGAGAFWDAIHAYGGTRKAPGEAVAALEEAIQVIRLLWNYGGPRKRVSFLGKYYQLENAQAGPSPHHNIGIWVGGSRSKMMELIGRSGDGWVIPLNTYISFDEIVTSQKIIDDAARKSGRSPESIARIANIVGVIDEGGRMDKTSGEKVPFVGSPKEWSSWLVSYYRDYGVDTFIFWPAAEGQKESQLRLFAEGVVPRVLDSIREKAAKATV